ncbi:E3 ubiquitin-protein ligase CHFR-like [Hydractinia symbiolongicarpus]|uniref:E3 ubiquitin-protein ligase CHFR-like n=1 Tax=Hydractinia symbiolongicarpus TaxID=13093 RepID=UPI00254B85A5|nr:E3 ubiquitin-protein ligase CHFR-like [Hydractinia symbiolongicarpus]XP_057292443.1 E3 ubiquitin-protein ligase CHFR-like [Hydractinia symbiolongicarpus]
MSSKRKERDQNLEAKLSELKQKQDTWMKQRSQSLSSFTTSTPINNTSKSSRAEVLSKKTSVKNTAQKHDALLWNTGTSNSYNGFVVRKKPSTHTPGSETSRSKPTVLTHSSLRNYPSRPSSAKSDKFLKSKSKKKMNNNSPSTGNSEESLDQKMTGYISRLDFGNSEYDSTKYELETNITKREKVDGTFKTEIKEEVMKNHYCSLCHQLMLGKRNAPYILYPCGHSFCLACVSGAKFCPSCQSVVAGMQENAMLSNVIQEFKLEKEREELRRKEAETEKYLKEYKSLSTRTEVMEAEATSIIDSMEEITVELVNKKDSIKSIEENATAIKQQIQTLQKQLKSLEEQHNMETETVNNLEKEYENQKHQLLMVEKTLKTLKSSQDRVKAMIKNLSPSLMKGLED